MADGVFVDTWGWVALGHRKDSRHSEVLGYYRETRAAGTRIYTSDYILDEVATLLFRRERFEEAERFILGILTSSEGGHLVIERISSSRFADAWELRRRFRDKPLISFTDLTSMVIMKDLGLTAIVTEDHHFLRVGLGFVTVP